MAYGHPQKVRSWRDSNDYRYAYFRKSPGLLGFIWFCSQCAKPLLGKKAVQVDHIVPPSKFAHKKKDFLGNTKSNTSMLAEAMNTNVNLVAACHKCNQKKSDKVGMVTAKGITAKVIETVMYSAQKVAVIAIAFTLKGVFFALSSLFRLAMKPLTGNHAWYVKLLFIAVYVAFIYYVYNRVLR